MLTANSQRIQSFTKHTISISKKCQKKSRAIFGLTIVIMSLYCLWVLAIQRYSQLAKQIDTHVSAINKLTESEEKVRNEIDLLSKTIIKKQKSSSSKSGGKLRLLKRLENIQKQYKIPKTIGFAEPVTPIDLVNSTVGRRLLYVYRVLEKENRIQKRLRGSHSTLFKRYNKILEHKKNYRAQSELRRIFFAHYSYFTAMRLLRKQQKGLRNRKKVKNQKEVEKIEDQLTIARKKLRELVDKKSIRTIKIRKISKLRKSVQAELNRTLGWSGITFAISGIMPWSALIVAFFYVWFLVEFAELRRHIQLFERWAAKHSYYNIPMQLQWGLLYRNSLATFSTYIVALLPVVHAILVISLTMIYIRPTLAILDLELDQIPTSNGYVLINAFLTAGMAVLATTTIRIRLRILDAATVRINSRPV